GVAAWIGRVPLPLAMDHAFDAGPQGNGWIVPAPLFVLALRGAAALLAIVAILVPRSRASWPQAPASRIGYAGLVVTTGIGWPVLLALSAHGPFVNPLSRLH